MDTQTGIQKALAKFDNNPAKLAQAVGGDVIRQHVQYWAKHGRVPAEKAPDVERATGVPCEELCPGANWAFVRGTLPAAVSGRAHV